MDVVRVEMFGILFICQLKCLLDLLEDREIYIT